MRETWSLAATTRERAAMTGRPAPTVDSYRTRLGPLGVSTSRENVDMSDANGFLLADTAPPRPSAARSSAGTVASVAVQSTTMALEALADTLSTIESRKSDEDASPLLASVATPAVSDSFLPPAFCAMSAAISASVRPDPAPTAEPMASDESATAIASKRMPKRSSCSFLAPTIASSRAAPTPPDPKRTKGTERHSVPVVAAAVAMLARERVKPATTRRFGDSRPSMHRRNAPVSSSRACQAPTSCAEVSLPRAHEKSAAR